VTDALGLPKPVQQPYPPLMIGGTGRKVLLRIVARYADMWNASASAERMGELVDVIRRHAERLDRDPARIEKTVMLPLCYRATPEREQFMCRLVASMRQCTPEEARPQIMIGSTDECLATVARYAKVGVTHFIFMTFPPYFVDEMQAFAEDVAPAARRGV
jgi:alkanesulfonate monooxygenase SsuD/methylene tetrahydromethanopterin reductase-like flavin-dependent oxidoreductase (luciferase family)